MCFMKILSYNINKFSQEKFEHILQYDADVFILPELASKPLLNLPDDFKMEWMGDIENKGLGVVWKNNLKAEIPSWFNPRHKYMLPIFIDEVLFIASWPTITDRKDSSQHYPRIAAETLYEYEPYLKQFPTIISGDMNCYKGQSSETKMYSIESIDRFLASIGYVSAYHNFTGEALGKESIATYYHQFKEKSPFFIDYTFTNINVKDFHLGEWEPQISDHVPQFIEI